MADSPTTRSRRHLEADGWHVEKVEQRVPYTNTTRDLFGFIDLLAIRGSTTMAVQVTSGNNVAARIRKIAESPNVSFVREAGWVIVVHGWRKNSRGHWVLREVDVS